MQTFGNDITLAGDEFLIFQAGGRRIQHQIHRKINRVFFQSVSKYSWIIKIQTPPDQAGTETAASGRKGQRLRIYQQSVFDLFRQMKDTVPVKDPTASVVGQVLLILPVGIRPDFLHKGICIRDRGEFSVCKMKMTVPVCQCAETLLDRFIFRICIDGSSKTSFYIGKIFRRRKLLLSNACLLYTSRCV